ncbi:hypothetical protein MYSTI_02437 [Myxococcus stipitatus DSM 14675]|uniref:Lipoprotein n=1 Tax=Myxococcus stipitatus (strain DSM 14675 / JCM 12634 / Mx s8) TaxID=1278073 RepID=L7U6K6_MYXSD|nr:hypothetical protein [Myxococcus stipitatus]AGC43753.1 hypothetical protein MYSTI_02437 [Myxococcus stipitatus DSM 14675]
MKLSLAVVVAFSSLSWMGCGEASPDIASDAVLQASGEVSQSASCSELPSCSPYHGQPCSTLYSRKPCCRGTDVDELVCSPHGINPALTWQFW